MSRRGRARYYVARDTRGEIHLFDSRPRLLDFGSWWEWHIVPRKGRHYTGSASGACSHSIELPRGMFRDVLKGECCPLDADLRWLASIHFRLSGAKDNPQPGNLVRRKACRP